MFRTIPPSITRGFSLYTQQYIQVCEQAVSKPVWRIPLLCVQWKTPVDGQRNCPKHVEFYSKHKFEKLVHLVGFIIRINFNAYIRQFYDQMNTNKCWYINTSTLVRFLTGCTFWFEILFTPVVLLNTCRSDRNTIASLLKGATNPDMGLALLTTCLLGGGAARRPLFCGKPRWLAMEIRSIWFSAVCRDTRVQGSH